MQQNLMTGNSMKIGAFYLGCIWWKIDPSLSADISVATDMSVEWHVGPEELTGTCVLEVPGSNPGYGHFSKNWTSVKMNFGAEKITLVALGLKVPHIWWPFCYS